LTIIYSKHDKYHLFTHFSRFRRNSNILSSVKL